MLFHPDLLYIHQPAGNWRAGYRQLENAYRTGRAKAIGISNFEGEYIEALEKEWPEFRAMAYFYLTRTDKEIYDLPHQEKVEKVTRIYQNEFFKPIKKVLRACNYYTDDKINHILEEEIWI